jgi:hypothetical protein
MDYTHIIHRIPSQETACLFRASDGMMLAECQQLCVLIGANPMKRESRLFIDHDHAFMYLANLADVDANGMSILAWDEKALDPAKFASVDYRNLEGQVVLAPGSVEMITNGGRYPSVKGFNKSLKQ